MPATVSLDGVKLGSYKGSLLVIVLPEKPAIDGTLAELDTVLAGSISRAIDARDFRGGRDEVFHLSGTSNGLRRVMLVGMGKISDRTGSLRRAAAIAARQGMKLGSGELAIYAALASLHALYSKRRSPSAMLGAVPPAACTKALQDVRVGSFQWKKAPRPSYLG